MPDRIEPTLLIDGDIILWSCACAAETYTYCAPDGEVFDFLKECKEYCEENSLDKEQIKRLVEAEPVSHVLHNVKSMVEDMKDRFSTEKIKIFLSPEKNFRHKIATIKPYKGNRVVERPTHYEEAKKYLLSHYPTYIAEDMEADDMMGIHQDEDTIICTIDKDLDQVPGLHYNWKKKILYNVGELEGKKNFYRQVLTGDSIDNIQGIPGVGIKRAEKILDGKTTEKEMRDSVIEAYRSSSYHGGWEKALVENANLVLIQRSDPPILWELPEEKEE